MKLGSVVYCGEGSMRTYGVVIFLSSELIQVRKKFTSSTIFNNNHIEYIEHYVWSYFPIEVTEI